MAEPIIAQKGPYPTKVELGKVYHWCACGHSSKQPFCDGSHNAFGLAPISIKTEKSATVYFCGCKKSAKKPYCDGTHSKL